MKNQSAEILKVLGNLLTEQLSHFYDGYKEIRDQYEKLYEKVTQSLYKSINETNYENKTELIVDIEETLDVIEFFTQFPQIINKTFMLIQGDAREGQRFFEKLCSKEVGQLIRRNNNIPTLITNGDVEIRSINRLKNITSLQTDEFHLANGELYKKDIDIRQLVSMYHLIVEHQFSHIAFAYIPKYAFHSSISYSILEQLADIVVLLADSKGKWKRDLQYLLESKEHKEIYVLFDREEMVEKSEPNVQFETVDQFMQNIPLLNEGRYNTAFERQLRNCFNEYYVETKKKMEHYNYLLKELKNDLLNISDGEMADKVRSIRSKLKKEQEDVKKAHRLVEKILAECSELAEAMEKALYETILKEEPKKISSEHVKSVYFKYGMTCVDVGNFIEAKKQIQQLSTWGSQSAAFLMIYLKLVNNEVLTTVEKTLFSKIPLTNPFIKRIFLKAFPTYIRQEEIFNQLEGEFSHSNNAQILYELGLASEALDFKEKAKIYFKRAAVREHQLAAIKYLSYVHHSDIEEIELIANLLIPEANYLAGMYYLEADRYAKGVTYLKIAASFEHLEAIKEISKIEFDRYLKVRNYDQTEAQEILENSIFLHQYILEKNSKLVDVKERLGKLYYWDKNYREAEAILSQCNTADAKFLCGKIYQYGNGVAQDLQKAKKYLTEAKKLGHLQAQVELRKVEGWIQSNASRERYLSGRSYESTTTYSPSHSSKKLGCFLTTATCIALGKPDNCEEIISYKHYRDHILAKQPDGEKLIIEYYRIAPMIVDIIDSQPNSKDIYIKLYETYIKPGYHYLLNNNLEMAKQTYIDMVKDLCEQYGIKQFQ